MLFVLVQEFLHPLIFQEIFKVLEVALTNDANVACAIMVPAALLLKSPASASVVLAWLVANDSCACHDGGLAVRLTVENVAMLTRSTSAPRPVSPVVGAT